MRRHVFIINLAMTCFGWWAVYTCFPMLGFPIDWLAAAVFGWSMILLWLAGRKVK